jgi:hypothetical protein
MKKVLNYLFFLLIFLPLSGNFAQTWTNPMKITPDWSGSFAELRSGHFHGGIDLRTNEKEGQPVYAIADGEIIDATVLATGYGKSLDIKHKNGVISRYGHLSAYIPELEQEVLDSQYAQKTFNIVIVPKGKRFVKQGELIAYSGSSGSSGGPHLHFEMRNAQNKIFNPCIFGYKLKDSLSPVISKLAVYQTVTDNPLYNEDKVSLINVVKIDGNNYKIKDTVKISSKKVAFGIESIDKLQNNKFKFGLYSMKLFIDDEVVFYWQLDSLNNSVSRDINAFIDYALYDSLGIKIQWTKKLPGNRLDIYKKIKDNGFFTFSEEKIYRLRFEIADFNQNLTKLNFCVKKIPETATIVQYTNERLFFHDKDNMFIDEHFAIRVTKNTLYQDVKFKYTIESDTSFLSSKVTVLKHVPAKQNYTLSLKMMPLRLELQAKAVIVKINKNGSLSCKNGVCGGGSIKTSLRDFGTFAVTLDIVPPVIKPLNFKNDSIPASLKVIKIKATDELSGIKSYIATIDGRWVLAEYDAKNDLFIINLDKYKRDKNANVVKLSAGEHKFTFTVRDNKDNITKIKATLYR